MAPTIEKKPKRIFCIQRDQGNVIHVWADTICRENFMVTLKREGEVVGEIQNGDAIDWWIEEPENTDQ